MSRIVERIMRWCRGQGITSDEVYLPVSDVIADGSLTRATVTRRPDGHYAWTAEWRDGEVTASGILAETTRLSVVVEELGGTYADGVAHGDGAGGATWRRA